MRNPQPLRRQFRTADAAARASRSYRTCANQRTGLMPRPPVSAKVRRAASNLAMRGRLPSLAQLLDGYPRWVVVPAVLVMILPNPLHASQARTADSFRSQLPVRAQHAIVSAAIVDNDDEFMSARSLIVTIGYWNSGETGAPGEGGRCDGSVRGRASQICTSGTGMDVRGPPVRVPITMEFAARPILRNKHPNTLEGEPT